MAREPLLPPTTRSVGFAESVKLQSAKARLASPDSNSARMGVPVSTAFSSGTCAIVSGKLQHTFVAFGIAMRLASPGVRSDSWMIAGNGSGLLQAQPARRQSLPLRKQHPALTFQKTDGLMIAFKTLNGSEKFFRIKTTKV